MPIRFQFFLYVTSYFFFVCGDCVLVDILIRPFTTFEINHAIKIDACLHNVNFLTFLTNNHKLCNSLH